MIKKLVTKRAGTCSQCGAELPVGAIAFWDSELRTLRCEGHQALDTVLITPSAPVNTFGIAAGSAEEMRSKYAKRDLEKSIKEKERFTKDHSFLSKYISPKQIESHESKAWAKGVQGELEVGHRLDEIAKSNGFITIHDRKMPNSKANIDHLAVTSSGIFIVDAKNYEGKIEVRKRLDGLINGESELWIGGRNRTNLVEGVNRQVLAIEQVLTKSGVFSLYLELWHFSMLAGIYQRFSAPNQLGESS